MKTFRHPWSAASMFVVALLFLGHVSFAQAALISDTQVEDQQEEVLLAIVNTLQEHVKLLQMVLIQKLEARVEYLQTLVDNQ
jgi:predicted HTH domain antitoxin